MYYLLYWLVFKILFKCFISLNMESLVSLGYATTQGLSSSVLGIMMGVGAAFGILATFVYPYIVGYLGLPKTGVLALGLQVSNATIMNIMKLGECVIKRDKSFCLFISFKDEQHKVEIVTCCMFFSLAFTFYICV